MSRDPIAGRIPVTLITGYLGSGKTTLIRRLLRDPRMNRAAVIINEFGEVGIDHDLVQSSSESTALLSNGCLCCALRTDLQETMRSLFMDRRSGRVIDFERVFVETSGLADPIPVLHTLRTDGLLGAQYRLDAVITVVDAVNGLARLEDAPEAPRQAAVADRIVITKSDLVGEAELSVLEERLLAINPYALRRVAVNAEVDVDFVRDVSPGSTHASMAEFERWLGTSASDDAQRGAYLGDRIAKPRHNASVRAFALWFEQPFTWDALSSSIRVLTELRGRDVLRVKGLVHVAGEAGPVLVQGAQHLFHPPVTLKSWPGEERRSRLVFVTRALEKESIAALFASVAGLAASPEDSA